MRRHCRHRVASNTRARSWPPAHSAFLTNHKLSLPMANSCEHVLEIEGTASERAALRDAFCCEQSIGIIDGDGHLPPLESLTPRPWKISHADDGVKLWAYWEMPRRPSLGWCERVSRAFPAVTVTVQYLYENDLGSGRLRWKAGSIIEDVHLMKEPEDFVVVTEQFYELVERAR